MKFLKSVSNELKILLAIALTLILAIIGGTVLREADRKREKAIANERTQKALGELWDSLAVNRAERKSEHAVIVAKLDSLLNPVWIILIGGLYV